MTWKLSRPALGGGFGRPNDLKIDGGFLAALMTSDDAKSRSQLDSTLDRKKEEILEETGKKDWPLQRRNPVHSFKRQLYES